MRISHAVALVTPALMATLMACAPPGPRGLATRAVLRCDALTRPDSAIQTVQGGQTVTVRLGTHEVRVPSDAMDDTASAVFTLREPAGPLAQLLVTTTRNGDFGADIVVVVSYSHRTNCRINGAPPGGNMRLWKDSSTLLPSAAAPDSAVAGPTRSFSSFIIAM